MIFNSFDFIIIFPVIFVFYWALSKHRKWQNLFLLAVSYILYMRWIPMHTLVLLGVTGTTYIFAIKSDGIRSRKGNVPAWFKWLGGILTLVPLLLYKYLPETHWIVPVGISFFTFQAYGYMMDVMNGKVSAERNVIDYSLFVSFFPQIVCGPISRSTDFLPQIKFKRPFMPNQFSTGLRELLWGMFMKVVVADRLGMYVDTVYADWSAQSGLTCAMASVAYTLQIYADFGGYSLMAVGVSHLLGFDLINNFRRPYFALSVTDFWHRWHISLSTWLKDYVYIPLGGSRCSKFRNYSNIMTTFAISGIWHGAGLSFIVWGALHGLFQVIEKTLGLNKIERLTFIKGETVRKLL